jgi:hypothetical protein
MLQTRNFTRFLRARRLLILGTRIMVALLKFSVCSTLKAPRACVQGYRAGGRVWSNTSDSNSIYSKTPREYSHAFQTLSRTPFRLRSSVALEPTKRKICIPASRPFSPTCIHRRAPSELPLHPETKILRLHVRPAVWLDATSHFVETLNQPRFCKKGMASARP